MAYHSYDIGVLGCLIQVGLKVGVSYANAGIGGSPGSWTGLIDTGASRTAISDAVVRSLSPQEVGRGTIDRPGIESQQVLIYKIQLKLDGYLSAGRWFALDVVPRPAQDAGNRCLDRDGSVEALPSLSVGA